MARLKEQDYINDARVKLAAASLTKHEILMLSELAKWPDDQVRGWPIDGTVLSVYEAAIMRLLDKRLIVLAGRFTVGFPAYRLTELGRVVAQLMQSLPTPVSERQLR